MKRFAIPSLLTILFLLSGCLETIIHYVIRPDGSATVISTVRMDSEMVQFANRMESMNGSKKKGKKKMTNGLMFSKAQLDSIKEAIVQSQYGTLKKSNFVQKIDSHVDV